MAYAVEGDLESLNWDAEPVLNLGPAATYGTSGNYEVDVLEAIEREYEHRDEYPFSVLFRFEDDTDDDEEASYLIAACDKVRLRVAFTGP